MNGTFVFYGAMLIVVAVLAVALDGPQDSSAYRAIETKYSLKDSPFSLPFNSGISSQPDYGYYQVNGEPPFP
jgi:hypothetical protein